MIQNLEIFLGRYMWTVPEYVLPLLIRKGYSHDDGLVVDRLLQAAEPAVSDKHLEVLVPQKILLRGPSDSLHIIWQILGADSIGEMTIEMIHREIQQEIPGNTSKIGCLRIKNTQYE